MKKEAIYPAILMTNACNKQCEACLRTANETDFKMEYEQFLLYINKDIQTLSSKYRVSYQFVTGGEPTIWKDNDRDIIDVLLSIDELEFADNLIMPTNGKIFEDIDRTEEFLTRLSGDLKKNFAIGLSIADYQDNFDDDIGCKALNNLKKVCERPEIKALTVILLTVSANDAMSERVSRKYPDVFARVAPLAPLGSAAVMTDLCPSLSLAGNDKSPLGSYLPHFKGDVKSKLGLSEEEFFKMPNAEIMNGLSLHCNCGNSNFISDKWHYCLPFLDNPDFDLAPIGAMQEDTVENFINGKPFIQSVRKYGIIKAVDQYKDRLSKDVREKLEEFFGHSTCVSVAYRGCMICKELHNIGVFDEVA